MDNDSETEQWKAAAVEERENEVSWTIQASAANEEENSP